MQINNKQTLRKFLLQQRIDYINKLSLSNLAKNTNQIYDNLFYIFTKIIKARSLNKKHVAIALFHPTQCEINLHNLFFVLQRDNYNICLPRICPNSLVLKFLQFRENTRLENNVYNILEPEMGAEVTMPNIIVVPTLGFDLCGHRIGYGKGYYDNTLSALKQKYDPVAIGIAYEFQKVTTVFPEAHDVQLDYIVTEEKIYNFI